MHRFPLRAAALAAAFVLGAAAAYADAGLNLGLALPGSAVGATATTFSGGGGSYSAATDAFLTPLAAAAYAGLEADHPFFAGRRDLGLGLEYRSFGLAMLRFDPEFSPGAVDRLTAYSYLRLRLMSGMDARIRAGLTSGLGPYLGVYLSTRNWLFGIDLAIEDIASAEGRPTPAGQKYDFNFYAGYTIAYRLRLAETAYATPTWLPEVGNEWNSAIIWGYGLGMPLAFAGSFLYLLLAR
jgi:hypothetical protein